MKPESAPIRPGLHWYAISLVVMIIGIAIGKWQIAGGVTAMRSSAVRLPKNGLVELPQAGTHSLYVYRGASRRERRLSLNAWHVGRTAEVSIRNELTGEKVAVQRKYEKAEIANNLVARVAEFHIPAPGTYLFQVKPPLDGSNPSVRPGSSLGDVEEEILGRVAGVFVGLVIGTGAVLASIAASVVVLVRRSHSQRELAKTVAGK